MSTVQTALCEMTKTNIGKSNRKKLITVNHSFYNILRLSAQNLPEPRNLFLSIRERKRNTKRAQGKTMRIGCQNDIKNHYIYYP